MTQADLQKALRAVDPAAVLVSSRILERVIREDLQLPHMYWNIPHRKSYVCNRQILFRHAEQADLELEPDQLLPDEVILIVRPDADEMGNLERQRLLLKYWRRLFHARIHVALNSCHNGGPLPAEAIRQRVEEIGRAEFEEIRYVLTQDNYLPPRADDASTYVEFASVYFELRHFAATLLRDFFPGIRDFERIEQLLRRDVNDGDLFAQTRLKDAPEPVLPEDRRSEESQEAYWKLVRMAQGAARSGNIVKAAILRMRASRIAPAAQTLPTRHEAENDIARLSERLGLALELSDAERAEWTRYLTLLLDKADQGVRPMEARVLEDMQHVCIDHEQEIYTLDVVEFLFSGGKRPIKRPLPSQRLVRIAGHLRSAMTKLGQVRLSDTDRGHLSRLIQAAQQKTETGLKSRFRPVLVTAFEDVGLKPTSPLQQVAFTKMVDELLDRISTYGYLSFAELRDTISRNHLKLPDLTEPEHFIRGDPLIRLDRRLGSLLDGVYRPGEFYVRWLERFTSMKFGTWWGRAITLWVTLPVLIAWVSLFVTGFLLTFFFSYPRFETIHTIGLILMGPAHVQGDPSLKHLLGDSSWFPKESPQLRVDLVLLGSIGPLQPVTALMARQAYLTPPHMSVWYHVTLLGGVTLIVLLLIHSYSFRRSCQKGMTSAWYALVTSWILFFRLVPIETVKAIVNSWVFQLVYWYILKPAAFTFVVYLLWPAESMHWYGVGLAFLVLNFLVNSRLGRSLSEWWQDKLVEVGHLIRAGLIPGLMRLIVQVFKQISDSIEYMLFIVDEWLRFRGGDNQWSLILRTIAGLLWAPVAIVVRFFMVVLIEPGYNPLKMPASYLAAKVMVPITGYLMAVVTPDIVKNWPQPFYALGYVILLGTFWHLPDVFGYLFWEMKENWALYRSNRGQLIRPAGVGSHNETIRALLAPGFHSGTIPRLYTRLRAAEKLATNTLNWNPVRHYRHEIEEVSGAIERFVSREMLALLLQHPSYQGKQIEVGPVHLATNRVRLELLHPDHPAHPVEIEIAYQAGWLLSGLSSVGWLGTLEATQVRVFAICLAYLYRRSDVDLVRDQVLRVIDDPVTSLQLTPDGIIAWSEPDQPPRMIPLIESVEDLASDHNLRRLVFSRTPISWVDWTAAWHDGAGSREVNEIVDLSLALVRLPRKNGLEFEELDGHAQADGTNAPLPLPMGNGLRAVP